MKFEIIVTNDKKGVIMRDSAADRWTEVSLEGECNGINPGDTFISPKDGIKSMVIGFSHRRVWAIKKGQCRIGCFDTEGETFDEVKATLTKYKRPMTAGTAEETINNFVNS